MLEILGELEIRHERQQVLAHHAAHHAADAIAMRLFVSVRDENLADDSPVLPARPRAAAPRAVEHRIPMRGDVARAHVEAEWHETVLAGELQRLPAAVETGDSDRRIRLVGPAELIARRPASTPPPR